jgi:hypothetical protein
MNQNPYPLSHPHHLTSAFGASTRAALKQFHLIVEKENRCVLTPQAGFEPKVPTLQLPTKIFLVFFSVKARVYPSAIVRLKGLSDAFIPST